jgi:type I restriction-modification system DNA methylase subunit
MALFQKSVLHQYIKQLDKNQVATAYAVFKSHFHNATIQQQIRESKEEQYQEGFFRDLFVEVLGFTLNPQPNYNLITEQKNEVNSKKADGAILKNGEVLAVIELKGTNTTDLNTVTGQAFGYKNNQKNCKYVLISNFEKLRFYIDNAIDFEEFDLFTLTAERFELLYLCLQANSLLTDVPDKIKQASTVKEGNVTKQLYKDYSDLKRKLFADTVHLNPQYDKLVLFKKSQKLLDRILFILFAEDRGLLQANTIHTILDEFDNLKKLDAYQPLYSRFKKHFTYLNEGFKNDKYEVFGYNGGLFAPDEILDTITISDNILQNHIPTLSRYDYDTEVDVNILGHIFEHSLNDIEEIQAELEGKEIDKTKTKRKKDGVFYTPKYITKYIVENTVGALCADKRNEYGIVADNYTPDKRKAKKKELLQILDTYQNWLLQITIVDPACGSGAFLNQALDFLIQEHKSIDELRAQLLGHSIVLSDHEVSILENNIFGVDLNEESVEIARLSLWLRTALKGRKLNSLNNNIKCGNSLIDDASVAGDKAFNWQQEFPAIFERGGFDVVIGNPPYVRQELVKQYSDFFQKKYKSYSGKADLFIYFYEKAISITKQDGLISFISSGKFLEASYGKPLLKIIIENSRLVEIINFKDLNIFDGISAYPLIFTFKKGVFKDYFFNYKDVSKTKVHNLNQIVQNIKFERIDINDFINNDFNFMDNSISDLVSKIENNSTKLEKLNLLPLVGVKTGFNDGFLISDTLYSRDYIFGRDIKKYGTLNSDSKIFFPYEFLNDKYELISENSNEINHLTQRDKLENRAIIKDGISNGTKKWFEFQQINKKLNFDNEYIVYPNVSLGNNFTLSKGNVIDMTGFIIPSNSKYLLSILNSKLISFLMELYAISRRGGYLEYKTQYISKLPIKQISLSDQQPFIEKAEIMLQKNMELQTIKTNFVKLLQSRYAGININTKLNNWNELTYKDFCKELEKQKIKLSISEQAELMHYFEQEQNKANSIQHTITQTDKEIDQMVYKLYELTPEEIAIVENN